ncbi:hypothetical protein ARMSODRAFT_437995 [Armillaria solidipes]|uniref:Uncharacterized protein n=1 Tax=Armillaria solidipes TaxID=1076256 RepID=A0A2H3B3Q2_9AGAR|nr:hypothetical protein ARMSODRAFT_437995 [Armillaria solidipes]
MYFERREVGLADPQRWVYRAKAVETHQAEVNGNVIYTPAHANNSGPTSHAIVFHDDLCILEANPLRPTLHPDAIVRPSPRIGRLHCVRLVGALYRRIGVGSLLLCTTRKAKVIRISPNGPSHYSRSGFVIIIMLFLTIGSDSFILPARVRTALSCSPHPVIPSITSIRGTSFCGGLGLNTARSTQRSRCRTLRTNPKSGVSGEGC